MVVYASDCGAGGPRFESRPRHNIFHGNRGNRGNRSPIVKMDGWMRARENGRARARSRSAGSTMRGDHEGQLLTGGLSTVQMMQRSLRRRCKEVYGGDAKKSMEEMQRSLLSLCRVKLVQA